MNSSKSLIDFMIDIACLVFSTNGKQDSPYDVNYTNHYVTLHKFEEDCGKIAKSNIPINKITQDRKNKSIVVDINSELDNDRANKIIDYCNSNDISISVGKSGSQRTKINNISISKNTKGVLEERKWKKEMK